MLGYVPATPCFCVRSEFWLRTLDPTPVCPALQGSGSGSGQQLPTAGGVLSVCFPGEAADTVCLSHCPLGPAAGVLPLFTLAHPWGASLAALRVSVDSPVLPTALFGQFQCGCPSWWPGLTVGPESWPHLTIARN